MFHGFGDQNAEGKIDLIVVPENHRIRISVKDNGCGMSEEKVAGLMASITTKTMLPEWTEHIGLYNVNERLGLCYGEDSGLHIESRPGAGTCVWFYGEKI